MNCKKQTPYYRVPLTADKNSKQHEGGIKDQWNKQMGDGTKCLDCRKLEWWYLYYYWFDYECEWLKVKNYSQLDVLNVGVGAGCIHLDMALLMAFQ